MKRCPEVLCPLDTFGPVNEKTACCASSPGRPGRLAHYRWGAEIKKTRPGVPFSVSGFLAAARARVSIRSGSCELLQAGCIPAVLKSNGKKKDTTLSCLSFWSG